MSDLNQYMAELVERHRQQPGDDLLSRMATDTGPEGRMADPYLVATAALLLVAGHETTVNLLGNGMLTLLRHPAILERLRHEPELIPAAVEELLRYEPPVQFLPESHHARRDSAGGDDDSQGRAGHAGPGRGQP